MARALVGFLGLLGLAQAQVPIPPRPDGFVYGKAGGLVILDGFFDLMCPDCKAAWPTVKQVAEHYGPEKLEFRFHTFPLPYHRNAYFANEGAHIVYSHNASAVYTWLEAVFAAQDRFGNAVTASITPTEVISHFATLAESSTGMPAKSFVDGMADPNLDWATRVSWKYACSRAVAGTPTFMVNGVQVAADSGWTLQQWTQLLDPLFATKPRQQELGAGNTCPDGEKQCEYLPGKVECCLPGEGCIPNVGCRCASAVGCGGAATVV